MSVPHRPSMSLGLIALVWTVAAPPVAHAGGLFDGFSIDLADAARSVAPALGGDPADPSRLIGWDGSASYDDNARVLVLKLTSGTLFEAARRHESCRFQDDDHDEQRPYDVRVVAHFAATGSGLTFPDPIVYFSTDPLRDSLAAAMSLELALVSNGWARSPLPATVGTEPATLGLAVAFTRDDVRVVVRHHASGDGTAWAALTWAKDHREVCPAWPPADTVSEMQAVSRQLREWRMDVPSYDVDWMDPRAFRRLRRSGATVLEIAELLRYGAAPNGGMADGFEATIARGQAADRTKLLPSDLDPTRWDGVGGFRQGLSLPIRECFLDLRLAVSPLTGSVPARLAGDPGFPGRIAQATVVVDAEGVVEALEPASSLQSASPKWERAVDTFWTCLKPKIVGATVSTGTGTRTGDVEVVGPF